MINADVMKEINKLTKLYEERWHDCVDKMVIPNKLSQEEPVIVLRRIVDTGESVIVGWNKIFTNGRERECDINHWCQNVREYENFIGRG